MKDQRAYFFVSQEHTTNLLTRELAKYKNKKCCVVAVSNNAVVMAKKVARKLGATLFFIPSRQIKNPADSTESIGVVSFDYVVTNNSCRDIPQDFIYHQTHKLRAELFSSYPGVNAPIHTAFRNRSVILIDDLVQTSENILGLLGAIKRQHPQEVVVAVPILTEDAALGIIEKASSALLIQVVPNDSLENAYLNFNTITDDEVTRLLSSTTEDDEIRNRILLQSSMKHVESQKIKERRVLHKLNSERYVESLHTC